MKLALVQYSPDESEVDHLRAAVCRAFGAPLTIEQVAVAAPGPNDVLVEVAACAICHSDIAYMTGAWGGPLPAVYGHEAAGVVNAVGSEVTTVAPGDSVAITLVRSCGECFYCRAGNRHLCEGRFRLDRESPLTADDGEQLWQAMSTGAFAEQVLVHDSQVAAVPGDIPPPVAALLACGVVTGFGAVTNTARVPSGATVAVVGTGGVGLNCIQGAVHAGADIVIAIDLHDHKLAMAQRLGATAVVNAAKQEVVAAVAELTGGRGADFVFVSVGSSRAIESSLPLLRRAGTLVIVGLPPDEDLLEINPSDLAVRGLRIIGSRMGSVTVNEDIPMLADLYRRGRLELDSLVSGTYSLDQINDAVASAGSGEAVRNVIVFDR